MNYPQPPKKCPLCDGKELEKLEGSAHPSEVFRCLKCEAVSGDCYDRDRARFVSPWFKENSGDFPIGEARYYDLNVINGDVFEGDFVPLREHGWYDPVSKGIIQVG